MSKFVFPTPSIEDEKQFHERNASILKIQADLINGYAMPYSRINELVSHLKYMQMVNRKFNIKFGLHKEIA